MTCSASSTARSKRMAMHSVSTKARRAACPPKQDAPRVHLRIPTIDTVRRGSQRLKVKKWVQQPANRRNLLVALARPIDFQYRLIHIVTHRDGMQMGLNIKDREVRVLVSK